MAPRLREAYGQLQRQQRAAIEELQQVCGILHVLRWLQERTAEQQLAHTSLTAHSFGFLVLLLLEELPLLLFVLSAVSATRQLCGSLGE